VARAEDCPSPLYPPTPVPAAVEMMYDGGGRRPGVKDGVCVMEAVAEGLAEPEDDGELEGERVPVGVVEGTAVNFRQRLLFVSATSTTPESWLVTPNG